MSLTAEDNWGRSAKQEAGAISKASGGRCQIGKSGFVPERTNLRHVREWLRRGAAQGCGEAVFPIAEGGVEAVLDRGEAAAEEFAGKRGLQRHFAAGEAGGALCQRDG